MSSYYIWNPFVFPIQPNTLKLILTRGETDAVSSGTLEFAQQLIRDIGLEIEVKSWSVKPCRSKYYSEYLGEEDWRDNWQILWKIEILSNTVIEGFPELEEAWIETNAYDESGTTETSYDDNTEVACLIISDFENELDLNNAQDSIQTLLSRRSSDNPTTSKSTFENFRPTSGYHQLQINIGEFPGDFFARGADCAEEIMNLCLRMNGTVHCGDRE